MPFDAVLFDLDGTLCESAGSPERVYADAFEAAGIDPFGEPGQLWAALDDPPDHDDPVGYLAAGFARVAAQSGRTPVDATALANGFLEAADYADVRPRDGARKAVEAAGESARIAVVTNGPRERQSAKLEELSFGDTFEAVVCAGDGGRRKPNSAPFDRALEAVGVSPKGALYVGDSLEYDVVGAQNAGIAAAWCPREFPADPDPYRPEFTLESLAELPEVLKDA